MAGGNEVGSTHNAFRYLIANINNVTGESQLSQSYADVPPLPQSSNRDASSYLVQKSTEDGLRTLLDQHNQALENTLRIEIIPVPSYQIDPYRMLKNGRQGHIWNTGNTEKYKLYFSLDINYEDNLKNYLQAHQGEYYVFISDNKNENNKCYFKMHNVDNIFQSNIPSVEERHFLKASWQLNNKADELKEADLSEALKNFAKWLGRDDSGVRSVLYDAIVALITLQNDSNEENYTTAIKAICVFQQFSQLSTSEVVRNLGKTIATAMIAGLVLGVVFGAVGFLTMGIGVVPLALIVGGILGATGGGGASSYLFFKPDDNSRIINEDCKAMRSYADSLLSSPAPA